MGNEKLLFVCYKYIEGNVSAIINNKEYRKDRHTLVIWDFLILFRLLNKVERALYGTEAT